MKITSQLAFAVVSEFLCVRLLLYLCKNFYRYFKVLPQKPSILFFFFSIVHEKVLMVDNIYS